MRLTLFLLLLFTGFVYANEASSQNARVSLNVRNAVLKDVLENIENQTDYLFVSNRDINLAQNVSIRAKNKPVSDVLNRLFENTDLSYAMEGINIILSRKNVAGSELVAVTQQKRAVTGVIVDNYGEPVIGANIVEKGTTNGIITDADGRFTLAVDEGAVLRVSYIGYIAQEVSVGNQSHLTVTLLEDLQALDEVIVIGYGTARRKDFTGSVSSVRLEDSPVALASNLSALEAIKGNVPGLDIGATNSAGGQPSMQIRGQKSISGSNDPLLVVDGVIYLGNINDINPNDIASFDILKDATSAAAYGSRSANGVIIITTKKGRTAKPVITLNASGSMQSWNNRPELMNGERWLESVMARNNSTDQSWMKPQETANMQAGKETDWLDASSRTGWVQDYQLSVSGSGEKMNYYLSTAYSDNKGVIMGDQYNRISVLGKMNTDITSWLQIGIDAAYAKSDYSGAGANLGQAMNLPPYAVLYRDEKNKLIEKYPYTQSGTNPLWGVVDGSRDNVDMRDNFRMNAYAVVKLPWLPGLSYRFNYAGNLIKENKGDFYYESNYVREGAYDDESRYAPAALQDLLSRANGNRDNRTTASWVIDNILNYTRTFGRHTVDVTAVATRDRKDYTQEVMRGNDFAANGNTTLGISGLHKATVQRVELAANRRSNIGYLIRPSYSFNDKYFLMGSVRRDGASVFGANQKWGNFVAVGAAWKITNENFMDRAGFLNDLKLKLSWGRNGNQGLDPYGTLSTIRNSAEANARYELGNSSKILYGMIPGDLGNADLGWEATQSWNTGFESAWLGNRIFLDLDLYFSKTTDQIFERNIPVMTGFKVMKSSMGQIDNRGVEITLRTVNIERQDLMWMTGFTFWFNRNKLAHLYGDDLDGDGKEDDDISNSRFIGKPLGAIYGYVQDGIVQESDTEYMQKNGVPAGVPKYKDIDEDGVITAEDRDILGYDKPNFKLNMSNTVSWKNFDLYAMLTGTFGGGGYYLKANREAYMTNGSGLFNSNSISIPWWTPENKSNTYPSAVFSGDGGRFEGLQNRGFVRLQDVTLSYTFREPWVKDLNIQNLKLFLTAKNLFTITKWEGDDPEVGSTVRAGDYPVLTSFSLGANISF
ncbi:MAG: TonB-dependent receptor [Tannerella sp.]|jgi:TonB-linked SusC/RagA family outer membrane protein|nr:TonB-dependent receptor [Tannerella sp.]